MKIPLTSALLTDLYALTMLQGYHAAGMESTAVFEFYVRHLPPQRNFLIAAGLEQVLELVEGFQLNSTELEWLHTTGRFGAEFLSSLANLRFSGDVDAMPEGTVFFENEPILRISAPLPQAQILETRIVNLLHFQTLVASKAIRCVLAAPGKMLVDFGLRRAHGAEAGLLAARACYLAGFSATSDLLAGQTFGIPVSGTMAHSFVQAWDSERDAFLHFARANPGDVIFLLDTYDTEAAAAKVVALAPQLAAEAIAIHGVRLDSGDLADHARRVRRILDEGGLSHVKIFASGGIDEAELWRLQRTGAPLDGFGLGTRVDTSADAPALDCAYKLQEYGGRPRLKLSQGKATWPGRKQIFRRMDSDGHMTGDVVTLEDDPAAGEPLLQAMMRAGKRLAPAEDLPRIRARVAVQLLRLPLALRALEPVRRHYQVAISGSLRALAESLKIAEELVV